jgi:type I site-specific restriction-modification system R (restriction) subunit
MHFCCMESLAFPAYPFRFKNKENKRYIFDEVRKKFVLLQPEEWVRQHVIHFLIHEKKYPQALINVEKEIRVNGLKKRYDVVVFKVDGSLALVVECKAPQVEIKQETFDQAARYNYVLQADFLMITNGLNHYFCKVDAQEERYIFLKELPSYTL